MKVARLSALRTGRLYPPGNIPGTNTYSFIVVKQTVQYTSRRDRTVNSFWRSRI